MEDGEFRVTTRVQGDRVGHVHLSYKAPEAFLRELDRKRAIDVFPELIPVVVVFATVVLCVIYFLRIYRAGGVRWGGPLKIGILASAVKLVQKINELPVFYQGYTTTQAMGTFLTNQAIQALTDIVFTGLGVTVLAAVTVSLYRAFRPEQPDLTGWFGLLRPGRGTFRIWRDALALGAAVGLAATGVGRVKHVVQYHWLTDYLRSAAGAIPGVNTCFPFLNELTGAAWGLLIFCFVLCFILVWQRALKRTWALVLLVLVAIVVKDAVEDAESLTHFSVLLCLGLLSWGTLVFAVTHLVRFNLLVYLIMLWFSGMAFPGLTLIRSDILSYQVNGAAALLLGLAPVWLAGVAYLKERATGPPAGE